VPNDAVPADSCSVPMFRSLFIALLILLSSGCLMPEGTAERGLDEEGDPLMIVATTSMIADLVREVGGDRVRVEGLMGPGIDPHTYQASEGDVSAMTQAHLILYNGLHLEGKMTDVFAQMRQRGLNVHAITEGIQPDQLLSSESFAGNHDPHIWFDPLLWQEAAYRIGELLAATDTLHAEIYRKRTSTYADRLSALFAEARERLSAIPEGRRILITSHDAFGYFGRAFGIEVRGLQGMSTALEAGIADVREVADFVVEHRIPALFVESSISPRGIQAVQEAVRARGFEVRIGGTLHGDALGTPGSSAESYIGMFRSNVETIVANLSTLPQ